MFCSVSVTSLTSSTSSLPFVFLLFMLSSHTSFLPAIQTSSIPLCQDLHTCLYYKYLNTHSPLSGLLKCHLLRKLLLGLLSKISTPLSPNNFNSHSLIYFSQIYHIFYLFKFWLSSASLGYIFMEPSIFAFMKLSLHQNMKMDSIGINTNIIQARFIILYSFTSDFKIS